MRRKPTNWNEMDTSIFQRKEKRLPVVKPSIIMSPGVLEDEGAWIVVSQYGGTESACADAYDGGASF